MENDNSRHANTANTLSNQTKRVKEGQAAEGKPFIVLPVSTCTEGPGCRLGKGAQVNPHPSHASRWRCSSCFAWEASPFRVAAERGLGMALIRETRRMRFGVGTHPARAAGDRGGHEPRQPNLPPAAAVPRGWLPFLSFESNSQWEAFRIEPGGRLFYLGLEMKRKQACFTRNNRQSF